MASLEKPLNALTIEEAKQALDKWDYLVDVSIKQPVGGFRSLLESRNIDNSEDLWKFLLEEWDGDASLMLTFADRIKAAEGYLRNFSFQSYSAQISRKLYLPEHHVVRCVRKLLVSPSLLCRRMLTNFTHAKCPMTNETFFIVKLDKEDFPVTQEEQQLPAAPDKQLEVFSKIAALQPYAIQIMNANDLASPFPGSTPYTGSAFPFLWVMYNLLIERLPTHMLYGLSDLDEALLVDSTNTPIPLCSIAKSCYE